MKATTTLGLLLAAVIACGGGAKKSDTAAASQPAAAEPAPAPEPAKPKGSNMGAGVAAARARSSFAMFPASTRVVAGVSIAQLRASAAWPTLDAALRQRASGEIKQLRDLCKLDAGQVVDSIEVATSIGASEDMVIIVDGSFTRAGIGQCGAAVAKSEGQTLAVTDQGATSAYSDGENTLWVGWPSDNRAVFGGEQRDRAWLEDRLAGKGSIRDNDAFMEVVGNVDTSATAWVALVDDNGSLATMSGVFGGRAPTAGFVSIRMADTVKGELGFVFDTEGDANVASAALEELLQQVRADPTFGSFVTNARVGVYGSNAVVEFDLNQEQFEKLIQMAAMAPF